MAEADERAAFLATGIYGKPLPPQNGGADPAGGAVEIRLQVAPRRSCTISFTDERPMNFWNTLVPHEYGFWANVNPDVAHPRWSQANGAAARQRRAACRPSFTTATPNGWPTFTRRD